MLRNGRTRLFLTRAPLLRTARLVGAALILGAALLPDAALAGTAPLRAAAPLPPSPPAYGMKMVPASIPLQDGVRLAANLYMPDGAKAGEKFPALLEYLPYRKDDGGLDRDH